MVGGHSIDGTRPALNEIREHAARALDALPEPVRGLAPADPPYPVVISDRLDNAARELANRLRAGA